MSVKQILEDHATNLEEGVKKKVAAEYAVVQAWAEAQKRGLIVGAACAAAIVGCICYLAH